MPLLNRSFFMKRLIKRMQFPVFEKQISSLLSTRLESHPSNAFEI